MNQIFLQPPYENLAIGKCYTYIDFLLVFVHKTGLSRSNFALPAQSWIHETPDKY